VAYKSPMLSVIMPVFNRAAYLEDAVKSVLAQSYANWELILVDDGSIDSSPQIIDRFSEQDPRIRCMHQENHGAAAARNRGVEMARAEWLCYLDSDDIWFSHTLGAFYDYLCAHPDAQFIYGFRHRLEDGKVTELESRYQSAPTGARELFQKMFLHPMSVCHRRDRIEAVGGFDEKLPLSEDYDLFLRMSPDLTFEPIAIATGLRRRHATNLSQQTGFSRMVQAGVLLRFLKKHGGEDLIPATEVVDRLGQILYSAGRQYFRSGHFRKCRRAFREGRKFHVPFKGKLLELCAGLLLPLTRDDALAWPLPLADARQYIPHPAHDD
jgi:glycosyltransferase involved in cell wall biosynthesis